MFAANCEKVWRGLNKAKPERSYMDAAVCIWRARATVEADRRVNARRRRRDELQHMLHFCQIV